MFPARKSGWTQLFLSWNQSPSTNTNFSCRWKRWQAYLQKSRRKYEICYYSENIAHSFSYSGLLIHRIAFDKDVYWEMVFNVNITRTFICFLRGYLSNEKGFQVQYWKIDYVRVSWKIYISDKIWPRKMVMNAVYMFYQGQGVQWYPCIPGINLQSWAIRFKMDSKLIRKHPCV